MDSQFQDVRFDSPCFILSLLEEHHFRLVYFHCELLVTVVGAHEENVASIRQGIRRNVYYYSVVCLRCIRFSW